MAVVSETMVIVMTDPVGLISGFSEAAAKAKTPGWPCPLRFEVKPAPHERPRLPHGEGAVYEGLPDGPGSGPSWLTVLLRHATHMRAFGISRASRDR
jgi:hypothetical protein